MLNWRRLTGGSPAGDRHLLRGGQHHLVDIRSALANNNYSEEGHRNDCHQSAPEDQHSVGPVSPGHKIVLRVMPALFDRMLDSGTSKARRRGRIPSPPPRFAHRWIAPPGRTLPQEVRSPRRSAHPGGSFTPEVQEDCSPRMLVRQEVCSPGGSLIYKVGSLTRSRHPQGSLPTRRFVRQGGSLAKEVPSPKRLACLEVRSPRGSLPKRFAHPRGSLIHEVRSPIGF